MARRLVMNIRLISSILSVIILGLGFKLFCSYVFAVQECNVSIDPCISHSAQQEITACIKDLTDEHVSAKNIIAQLQQQFPFIKSVSIAYVPCGITDIELAVYKPRVLINNQRVLTCNDKLVDKNVFTNYQNKQLIAIATQSDNQDDAKLTMLKQYCVQLPTSVFDVYDLCYVDDAHAWLHDKKQTSFSILFNDTSMPSEKVLQYCAQIKNDLISRRTFEAKKNKQWIADIRFKNQIVLYSTQGGWQDGSHFFRSNYHIN